MMFKIGHYYKRTYNSKHEIIFKVINMERNTALISVLYNNYCDKTCRCDYRDYILYKHAYATTTEMCECEILALRL